MDEQKKPELHLANPRSLESIISLYKKLTGKDPTPEELERAKQKLAQHKQS